ncbi:hypothetical protein [Pikeienuella sp. HZG-20]|uniref:hypothetical protein n=1 Tax=Paludibacillus litoralis TaxID=3133267 RepID=UPI0030ECB47B
MAKLTAVFNRFPEHELVIHRLCGQEPDFMGVCEDYEEAVAALRRWEEAGAGHVERAREYRVILDEIESDIREEISTYLARLPR